MKRIGVITAGGDAPGMNAAIRAVVRVGIFNGFEVYGIERGYQGLIEGSFIPLNLESVSGIINRGGTILKSMRCEAFKTRGGRQEAYKQIDKYKLDGLLVIGGDGTFEGARLINIEGGIPTIAIPATIDNDVGGTDYSIGFDTAVNNALEAIDKIRDTATAHERIFVVEVMGREKGFLALEVGLAAGAEAIIIPEVEYNIENICERLAEGRKRGKRSSIIVVAEGAASAHYIALQIKELTGWQTRVSVLGYLQRGGAPTAFSRILACRLGAAAVELLSSGEHTKMVGIKGDEVCSTTIDEPYKFKRQIDLSKYELAKILAI